MGGPAKVSATCSTCGGTLDGELGQSIPQGRLVWWIGWHCLGCGARIEEDGQDLPPAGWRTELLAQSGYWTLVLERGEPNLIRRVFRRALGISLADAAGLPTQPGGMLRCGTEVEMLWLAGVLRCESDTVVVSIIPGCEAPLLGNEPCWRG